MEKSTETEKVLIVDPDLPTVGQTVFVLCRSGRWLLCSWEKSPWALVHPFILSMSQVTAVKEENETHD